LRAKASAVREQPWRRVMVGREWHGEVERAAPEWYERRADALARPLEERLRECGLDGVTVACACGRRSVKVRCGQRWLCRDCQKRTYARLRSRLARAMKAHLAAAQRARAHGRGQARRPVLMTLTTRHSGDLAADRERIGTTWRRTRQWMHKRVGKFVYALVWEVTPGRDALGHVHAHVVTLLPWVDFRATIGEVKRASGGECSMDFQSAAKTVRSLVGYLAKYATKGVQVADFSAELAARVLDATYAKRAVSASRAFWLPEPPCACKACGEPWRVVAVPPAGRRGATPVWLTHALGGPPAFGLAFEDSNGTWSDDWIPD
jgi:hypothetical protein